MSEDKIGGHPSPHARRDKTEDYDMRDQLKEKYVAGQPTPPIVIPSVFVDPPFQEGGIFEDPATWPLPPSPLPTQTNETMGEGQDGGGLRMNAGKNRIELLPPEWLWALGDVMSQGAKKYDARNWEKGMGWGSMIGCIQRHVLKFMAGERYDGDGFDVERGTTGCHHLAMAAWNCLALMTYDLRKIGKNDLADEVTIDLLNAVNAATAKIEKGIKDESG